jgi:transposase
MWAERERPPRASEPRESAAAPKAPPRFQAVNRQPMMGRAVAVERWVEPDHRVRAIGEMSGRLDLPPYPVVVRAVEGEAGRPPIDPRLPIGLWIYAYSEKVRSAREVSRRCAYPPAYPWRTGCEISNDHTLADFRLDHQKALEQLFAPRLAVLSSEGLITLEQVGHDGTKVKAAASGQSFHREKTLPAHREAAPERVRGMGDPRQDAPGLGAQRARGRHARKWRSGNRRWKS